VGEELTLFGAEFNQSVRVESREERLTCDAGAIVLREIAERLGLTQWLAEHLVDSRSPVLITHPLVELVLTEVLLLAQGWRDIDDADSLRDDPAFRLAVSTRKGIAPLMKRPATQVPPSRNPAAPDGLASQPTLSRLTRMLSSPSNLPAVREALLFVAASRVRALRRGHRMRHLTIDVDGLPVEVHGHQPGSAHNGYYHGRIYHPLVATAAETGDLLDVRLREGNAHTAECALDFILPLIDRVERDLCQVASVRMDAGFPEEKLLSALESRDIPYVARVRNNAALDRLAEPHLRRPPGRPPHELRTWLHEMTYQAKSWSAPRRVVLVVLEREQEMFLHHFWLITNWGQQQMPAAELLDLYRQRGTAEAKFGELLDVLDPLLSSTPRTKSHYRGQEPARRYSPGDAFAQNEVRLLLNALAYNLLHAARVLLQQATHQRWSLRRVHERLLRVAARVLVHARRATFIIARSAAKLWHRLWASALRLAPPAPS
jgi:hypothetical protein